MAATAIGPMKAMVLSLNADAATQGLNAMLAAPDHRESLREPLQGLADRLAVRL
jgi:signal transduction protein with GAF and PtsI domain